METYPTNSSRRDFLRFAGVASVAGLMSRLPIFAGRDPRHLEMLVVGDSLIWGQGLEAKDKFYSQTAEWLRRNAFGQPREVRLKVKAHSGSTIKLHVNEAEALERAGRTEETQYTPEVNVGFPSIWHQIDSAREEYASAGISRGADIIMVSGGITDITVTKVLSPFADKKLLLPLIEKYCSNDMFDLLQHASTANPGALIVVIGYYPILSPKTDAAKLFNGWLEAKAFPRALKSFANNPLTRPTLLSSLRKKAIERSRIWFTESNRHLQSAVVRHNKAAGRTRAVFVESPITEETCLETPNTHLFRMGRMGRPEDPLFPERLADCRAALPELKRTTGLDYSVRICEIAGVGHPNAAGSTAYTAAIKAKLALELANRPS